MRATWLIARRELASYFTSPIAYAVTAVFMVIVGYFFGMILYLSREATMRYLFYNVTTFLLLIGPALTMRLVAEERKSGTIELLLTAPVRDGEVIVGKFLAALLLWALMLALTLVYPLLLRAFGNPDPGPILSGYLGLLLAGGAVLSLGVVASTLTANQIVAALVAFGLSLMLWLADALQYVVSGPVGQFFAYLSLSVHFADLPKGVIDTKDVIFYLSIIVASLFVATRILEARRWKG
ncbi:MAG TPA: ABC transporter permease [Anaerolineae bacterium]|nr:ABC transporter permease [Anaerolineae bacterium]HOR01038.1 ABC transporter permease [Anaerolineae bacterium]HPL29829.1 ABC transporter permease [Anaerolineae bacterium]